MKNIILSLTAALFLGCLSVFGQTLPYQDISLPVDQRVEDLLGRLTLEQKATLMMHESAPIYDLDIHEYCWWNEALHGCARAGLATVFPQAIGMAASWDPALLEEVFTVASIEQRIKYLQYRRLGGPSIYHGLTVWTPNINIFRDPRWGRGQETYGEDPFLTARMGAAVVRGLQGEKQAGYDRLHACLKHYAVHSGPESLRHSFDVHTEDISYRHLVETYLYAFEDIISKTDVREVMCAYQRLDGKPCCGNDQLLQSFLRDKWGYKGLVVSDCWAIYDFFAPGHHETFLNDASAAVANAVRTGTDVECGQFYGKLVDAVEEGKITEDQIDVSVRRLLTARFDLGEMDYGKGVVPWDEIDESLLSCDEHRALSLKMARESMVLLQNDGVLPLSKEGKFFVAGPNAENEIAMLGNYNGTPREIISALEGISSKVETLASSAQEADVIIYIGGITPQLEGEEMKVEVEGFAGGDRTTIELPKDQRAEIAALAALGKPIVYVNMSGSAIGLEPESGICSAMLQAWYGGEFGGEAIADVLFGDVNPSGKLPITFYRSDADLPSFEDYSMEGRTYRYFSGSPLWAFGHGLSYSTFVYGKARIEGDELVVPVTNKSAIDGDEIVQAYMKCAADVSEGPLHSLRGFARISVPAGQTVEARIALGDEFFESFDPATGEMAVLGGSYTILYGSSSDLTTLKSLKVKR